MDALTRLARRIRADLLKRPGFTPKPVETQRCPACGMTVANADFDLREGECRGCVDQGRVNVEWPDLGPFLPDDEEN